MHLFCVEFRPLLLIYISYYMFIHSSAMTIVLFLRPVHVAEWCHSKTCTANLYTFNKCISSGIGNAMLSFDLGFSRLDSLCVEFHRTNILGYLHLSSICIFALIVLCAVYKLHTERIKSFTDGRYIVFTTNLVRQMPLMQFLMLAAWLNLASTILIGPITVLFLIPEDLFQKVNGSRFHLLQTMFWFVLPSCMSFILSTVRVVGCAVHDVNIVAVLGAGIEIKRSWKDFLVQSNRECEAALATAIVEAKYGSMHKLTELIVTESRFGQAMVEQSLKELMDLAKPAFKAERAEAKRAAQSENEEQDRKRRRRA